MSQQFALAFSRMRSPEELRLAEVVRSKGGVDAVKNNDAVLRELFKAEKPPTHSKGTPVASAAGNAKALQGGDGTKDQRVSDKSVQRSEYTFSDFKVELREDWDTALQSNLEAFEGKFRLFYDQLEASLHRYMQEESNRVIEEVTKGPHNLIQEPVRLTVVGNMQPIEINIELSGRSFESSGKKWYARLTSSLSLSSI